MKHLAIVFAIIMLVLAASVGVTLGAVVADNPGPRLQYGGTPIELHFDAPGANVTKVYVDGTPCIVVSDGDARYSNPKTGPVIALSCDWTRR